MPETMPKDGNGMEASVLERLIGATGAPDHVMRAARNFAERSLKPLEDALNELFGHRIDVELTDVRVDRMAATLEGCASNEAVIVTASSISPDALTMRLDTQAIGVIVDHLFGAGPDMRAGILEHELSQMEIDASALALQKAAGAFNGTGWRSLQIRFPLPPVETGDALRKMSFRDGPSVRVEYSIGAPGHSGTLVAVLPQRVLLNRANADAGDAAAAGKWSERFSEEVLYSQVTLQATVPAGTMSLGEVAELKRGQLIELSADAPGEARLSARNKTLFMCEFGRLGQNYTVRIKSAYRAGTESHEGPGAA
ncbi:FliM/FliN family flagellar motor switch protein [Mesorhizobium xinjiangense]|uniref:FliM/FliN family flagellar motor switch protein n=1 Tax=Mesorhizobium xinjiangense TaxID=2678685 RepID=UPI0012ECDD9F|nr:FliM/FliN family flagellar motor switch protein [Mesorhizobium xinjiangense]